MERKDKRRGKGEGEGGCVVEECEGFVRKVWAMCYPLMT